MQKSVTVKKVLASLTICQLICSICVRSSAWVATPPAKQLCRSSLKSTLVLPTATFVQKSSSLPSIFALKRNTAPPRLPLVAKEKPVTPAAVAFHALTSLSSPPVSLRLTPTPPPQTAAHSHSVPPRSIGSHSSPSMSVTAPMTPETQGADVSSANSSGDRSV